MEKAQKIVTDEIQKLTSVLLSTLDEGLFFGELCKFMMDKVQADRVLINKVLDDNTSVLVVDSGLPILETIKLEKGKGLASYVTRTKRAYYSNNVKRDPLLVNFAYSNDVNAELCIPVASQGMVLATIHFLSSNTNRGFSESDVLYISQILSHLERPILNMKMYLSAKNLNESLMKKIQDSEEKLLQKASKSNADMNHLTEEEILGHSQAIKSTLALLEKVSAIDVNTLIEGEIGTGKELIGRKIHLKGSRKEAPYLVINCNDFQEASLEIELFGQYKGTFNGDLMEKSGLLELANNGTLFLNEVSSINPYIQTKLLRFLQTAEAFKVGSSVPYRANVRIVSSSTKDLKKEVEEGRFRQDLYYLLNAFNITVPALRERAEDIETIAHYFLNAKKEKQLHKTITQGALKVLMEYSWPGNIPELKNIIERASIICEGQFIEDKHLPDTLRVKRQEKEVVKVYREMTLDDLEKEHICNTLNHLKGNKTKTARVLGITVKTLYNKLHSYGMIQDNSEANS